VKTITLEEDWRLTSILDIDAGEGNVIIIDGQNKYTIYEMNTSAYLKNSSGIVRFKDVKLIHAGTVPQPGSLAELLKAASGITSTSVTAPAKNATTLTMPSVPSGFAVSIKSSSNENVIKINGTIGPPSTEQTINLVFTVSGNGGEAETASIPVTVPAKSSGGYIPSAEPPVTEESPAAVENSTIILDATVTNGTAKAVVDGSYVNAAFEQAGIDSKGMKTITLEIKEASGADSYSAQLPAGVFKDGTEDKQIEIKTPAARLIASGMIQGSDGKLSPKGNLTREEAVRVVYLVYMTLY